MRVVLDTNVVVSAILRNRLPEKVLLFVIGRPEIEWVASEEMLAEYRTVLRRPKFGLSESILGSWDERFREAIACWPVRANPVFSRDPGDAKFLACALASQADYLITGDHDFSEAGHFGSTLVVSVAEFDRRVCQPA